jgi:hypothetical protein
MKKFIDKEARLPATEQQKPFSAARSRSGQAALEYVLVLMMTALVFGFLFWAMRITLYDTWVCYMGPRIQSPAGCTNTDDCWNSLKAVASAVPSFASSIDSQRDNCTDVYSKF